MNLIVKLSVLDCIICFGYFCNWPYCVMAGIIVRLFPCGHDGEGRNYFKDTSATRCRKLKRNDGQEAASFSLLPCSEKLVDRTSSPYPSFLLRSPLGFSGDASVVKVRLASD